GHRVLQWRNYHYGDGLRFGFDQSADDMAHRLSEWLITNPVFLSPDWPYDVALLYGAQWDNARMDERLVANGEEFNRRYAFPRLVSARAEDFFGELERRWGARIPVRRGDTGLYWEDGAASTAAALAQFRTAQLAARAADLLAWWDERLEPHGDAAAARGRQRAPGLQRPRAAGCGSPRRERPGAVPRGAAAGLPDPDGGGRGGAADRGRWPGDRRRGGRRLRGARSRHRGDALVDRARRQGARPDDCLGRPQPTRLRPRRRPDGPVDGLGPADALGARRSHARSGG